MDQNRNNAREELFYLADENGEQMAFHFLDLVLYEDREYLVLLPAEGPYRDEVVILRHERGEGPEGEGYEGVTKFVLDRMTSYGLNACPPLLVGVGVATSVETAALLSKKALMRPIGSHNENERAAKMEKLLEDGINAIGLGPQGMGGKYSVMGVNIENTARHPSAIGVAVNVGCWSHRRGHIIFDKDLNYTITSHSGVTL